MSHVSQFCEHFILCCENPDFQNGNAGPRPGGGRRVQRCGEEVRPGGVLPRQQRLPGAGVLLQLHRLPGGRPWPAAHDPARWAPLACSNCTDYQVGALACCTRSRQVQGTAPLRGAAHSTWQQRCCSGARLQLSCICESLQQIALLEAI